MERPYIVELEKREGYYFLIIPELSLVVSSKDISTAFEDLERAKCGAVRRMELVSVWH
jgi:hypothetical protein